jgi:hypothetical protein
MADLEQERAKLLKADQHIADGERPPVRNYDPLVQSTEIMRQSASTLRTAEEIADGNARTRIRHRPRSSMTY